MNKFVITAVGPYPDFDTMYVVDTQKGHVYFTYYQDKATTYDTQEAAGAAAQSIAASTKSELSVEQIWVETQIPVMQSLLQQINADVSILSRPGPVFEFSEWKTVAAELTDLLALRHEYEQELEYASTLAADDIWMSMQAMNGDPTIDSLE